MFVCQSRNCIVYWLSWGLILGFEKDGLAYVEAFVGPAEYKHRRLNIEILFEVDTSISGTLSIKYYSEAACLDRDLALPTVAARRFLCSATSDQ
jgi:hypothetical protein